MTVRMNGGLPQWKDLSMTEQGNRVPDASADEKARAAATEDYGGVPISDQELADVWVAPAETDGDEGTVDSDASGT